MRHFRFLLIRVQQVSGLKKPLEASLLEFGMETVLAG